MRSLATTIELEDDEMKVGSPNDDGGHYYQDEVKIEDLDAIKQHLQPTPVWNEGDMEGYEEELDFSTDVGEGALEFNSEYESSSPTSQVTVEETVKALTKKAPKETILSHFNSLYENLQKKLCQMIEEGGILLDERSNLTFVLDMQAELTLFEGRSYIVRQLPSH